MVLKELNINAKDWKKLLEVPVAVLLDLQYKLPSLAPRVQTANKKKGLMESSPGAFLRSWMVLLCPRHPFDPVAPSISKDKPLMVGWSEDEYNFFGMMSNDKSVFRINFDEFRENCNSSLVKIHKG